MSTHTFSHFAIVCDKMSVMRRGPLGLILLCLCMQLHLLQLSFFVPKPLYFETLYEQRTLPPQDRTLTLTFQVDCV